MIRNTLFKQAEGKIQLVNSWYQQERNKKEKAVAILERITTTFQFII